MEERRSLPLPNHLAMTPPHLVQSLRKGAALSQEELAILVGVSQSTICRLELNEWAPSLEVAFALELIFGRSPKTIFAELLAHVEEIVGIGAATLDAAIDGKTDPASIKKQHLLSRIVGRISSTGHRA
jgi:DNA-binding XRE family transcriptional regulator